MGKNQGYCGAIGLCSRRIRVCIAVAVCGVWLTAPARAATDLLELPLEKLMETEVYSASRFTQNVTEAPSAVTIVTGADIKTYGYRTLAQILNSIRGLYVTYDHDFHYLGVHGFGRSGDFNARITLLVDGYRVNDTVYDTASIGTEQFLDVDLIERVEFVPGPGSSVYGSNALFGIVNVITKSGRHYDGAEVKVAGGSFHTGKVRTTYGKHLPNDTEYLLSATRYTSRGEDLRFEGGDRSDDLDSDQYKSFFGKFRHKGFSLEAGHIKRPKNVPTGAWDTLIGERGTKTIDTQTMVDGRYEWEMAPQLEATARVYWGRYEYDARYMKDGSRSDPARPNFENRDDTRARWWGTEFKVLSTQFARHKIVAGVEYLEDLRRDQKNFDVNPTVVTDNSKERGHRFGLYAQDEYYLTDKVILNAGVRYDNHYEDDGIVSPRAGVIYRVTDRDVLKFLYGSAYRAPNAYEKFYGGEGQKANPDLDAERIQSYQVVYEAYPRDNLRFTAVGFHYRIRDLINLTEDPDDGLLVFDNLSDAKSTGIELETKYLWGGGGEVRFSTTYQETRDTDTDEILENSPRLLAKLHFATPVIYNGMRAGIEVLHVGSRSAKNDKDIDSYTVTNLALSGFRVSRGLQAGLSVRNLFNEQYLDPASDEHRQDTLPTESRSVWLELIANF